MRNVILDWSGTLVDDLPPVLKATNGIFGHFGKAPMSREEFLERFRLPFTEFYAEHLPGIPMDEIEPLYVEHFGEPGDDVEVLPHAREFLEYCRGSGRRMFVLSSTKAAHFEAQAAMLKLDHYFEEVYVEAWNKKETIGRMLKSHEMGISETVFVGDMIHDVDTARHAGVRSVAVLTGYDSAAKLAGAKPDLTVENLSELREIMNDG